MSHTWRLEFSGGFWIFGNSWTPWPKHISGWYIGILRTCTYLNTYVIVHKCTELYSVWWGVLSRGQCSETLGFWWHVFRWSGYQGRTQEFCWGGGGFQQIQFRTEDRENEDLGGGSPLVRGSGGSCNLVQEISFHTVNFSSFLVL